MPKRPSKPNHDDELEDEEPPRPCYTPEEVVEQERAKRAADVMDKWWYRNRDGEGVLLRFRLETNDCNVTLQAVMHGYDQWATGWPANKKVPLYRVYEIVKWPIFIVQGEDAADSAIAMGLSAVTSAGGADDVDKSDWRPTAGRPVIILPTNSDEGRHFARAVARMVIPLDPAPQVRMVALPGLAEGEDIGSFGWNLKLSPAQLGERVRELASRAPVMKPVDLAGWPLMKEATEAPPAPVRWLWPGRVPIGKPLAIFGGLDPGKSIVALDLAARVSAGAEWPDVGGGGGGRAPRGKVILMCRDDHLNDTIRPRLDRAGADPRQIIILDSVMRIVGNKEVRRDITLFDLADLERAVEIAGNVRLIVIDPLSAYFGPVMASTPRILSAIRALTDMADRYGLAVIITAELGGRDGLGCGPNKTLVSAVRSAWMLAPDPGPFEMPGPSMIDAPGPSEVEASVPDALEALVPTETQVSVPCVVEASVVEASEPGRRRFLLRPLKSVGGDIGEWLACRINGDSVVWEPGPIMGADRMLPHALRLPALGLPGTTIALNPLKVRCGPKPVARDAAGEWLLRQLAAGPVPVGSEAQEAGTVRPAARLAGLAWSTVQRAFQELHGFSEKCPDTGKHIWRLQAASKEPDAFSCTPNIGDVIT